MFNFRTQSLNAIVWLLAVSQLLLQPAAGLLHSGCDGHSHAEVASTAPHSFWHTFELAWHWVTGHHGCQHSHSKHSESEGPWKSRPNQPKTCAAGPANCLVKSPPSDVQCGNSHDPPIPVHDAHQCPICQVVFAARTNTVVLQLPEPTGWISLAESWAVPVIDTAPRFELPSRGPPTA